VKIEVCYWDGRRQTVSGENLVIHMPCGAHETVGIMDGGKEILTLRLEQIQSLRLAPPLEASDWDVERN
jgi:hypothetical protein